jgi:peptidoglycan-N-acetylglucosamine deacetylase
MLKFKTVNTIFIFLVAALLLYDWQHSFSLFVYAGVAIVYILILVYGVSVISAQFFVPARFKGSRESGAIALTFDDGPLPGKTEMILKILQEHQASAAFFCIGNRIEKNPELLKQIHDAGHVIGNHSFSHSSTFDLQPSAKMIDELKSTAVAIEKTIGMKPRFFRPPYGVTNPNLAKAIRSGNYLTVGWSIRSFDTMAKDQQKLFKRVTKHLEAGDVILFHDYCDITIQMLPSFLNHIKKIGLKVVRIDQLLNEPAYFSQIDPK